LQHADLMLLLKGDQRKCYWAGYWKQ